MVTSKANSLSLLQESNGQAKELVGKVMGIRTVLFHQKTPQDLDNSFKYHFRGGSGIVQRLP
jgi:hypothetical protein